MGMCAGKTAEPNLAQTPEKKLMRILMLGIGGSGKSTVTQQLRILHNPKSKDRAFTAEEISNYAEVIVKNLYQAFEVLLRDFEGEDEGEAHDFFRNYREQKSEKDHKEQMDAAKEILEDEAFKNLCLTPGIYPEIPTLNHYIAQFETVLDTNYVPTDEDIVKCKQRTVGISRSRFKRDKLVWEVIDAGGQPVERKKWDRILEEEIRAVIYVVAVNEFDVPDKWLGSAEDEQKKMRVETALETWKKVITDNGDHLDNVILFINKIDILKEKLSKTEGRKAFKAQFSDFEGDMKDKEQTEAIEYLKQKFLSCVDDEKVREDITVHPTVAVNAENIKIITDTVFDRLFANRMRNSGVTI
mmetsp:Transcript_17952/g.19990  ORF Transcript_17952/g.19990 Transcript_17952/m.19990 type:complete len:356 (-) Transcript_17952:175-1242(-)